MEGGAHDNISATPAAQSPFIGNDYSHRRRLLLNKLRQHGGGTRGRACGDRSPSPVGISRRGMATSDHGSTSRSGNGSPILSADLGRDGTDLKVAGLPDDVREQVHRLIYDNDDQEQQEQQQHQAAASSDGVRIASKIATPFGEPTRLSAQPTVEEIQMCFAQIDLAILMEAKPPTRSRFSSPNFPARSSSAVAPHAGSNLDRLSRRRAPRTSPQRQHLRRLHIPPAHTLPSSDSDTFTSHPQHTSHDPQPLHQSPSPMFDTDNLSPAISHMQQLLLERSESRRKFSPAVNLRASSLDPLVNDPSSRASSPVMASTVAVAAAPSQPTNSSSMQQRLIERAKERRSVAAMAAITVADEDEEEAAANSSSGGKGNISASHENGVLLVSPASGPELESAEMEEGSTEVNQKSLDAIRKDFMKKLGQIQALARGPSTLAFNQKSGAGADEAEEDEEYGGGAAEEDSSGGKENKRAYQFPIWTHRSCSSSSLNSGGQPRWTPRDNMNEFELLNSTDNDL